MTEAEERYQDAQFEVQTYDEDSDYELAQLEMEEEDSLQQLTEEKRS